MIQQKTCYRFTKAVFSILAAALCFASLQARAETPAQRITAAGQVFQELVNASNGIPRNLLNKADCVIVLPSVKKGGFIIGGQ